MDIFGLVDFGNLEILIRLRLFLRQISRHKRRPKYQSKIFPKSKMSNFYRSFKKSKPQLLEQLQFINYEPLRINHILISTWRVPFCEVHHCVNWEASPHLNSWDFPISSKDTKNKNRSFILKNFDQSVPRNLVNCQAKRRNIFRSFFFRFPAGEFPNSYSGRDVNIQTSNYATLGDFDNTV